MLHRRGVVVLLGGLPADLELPAQVALRLLRPGRPPLSCSGSVEVCSFPEGHVFVTRNLSFPESLGEDYQIFEAEWDETKIVGKINGITYYQKAIDPDKMEEFQRDFFLILNVAMGGTLGSNSQPPTGRETFPQTMLVDYVRVYQRVD